MLDFIDWLDRKSEITAEMVSNLSGLHLGHGGLTETHRYVKIDSQCIGQRLKHPVDHAEVEMHIRVGQRCRIRVFAKSLLHVVRRRMVVALAVELTGAGNLMGVSCV